MKKQLPPEEYYASLAKVPTSAGAIFQNSKGEFLIIKNTYKEEWGVVGGMSDKGETPSQTLVREVKEEIGLSIQNPKAFCIDFKTKSNIDGILFLFNGGILSEDQISKIQLQENEIETYMFVPFEKMVTLMSPRMNERLKKSIDYFTNGTCLFLEDGK